MQGADKRERNRTELCGDDRVQFATQQVAEFHGPIHVGGYRIVAIMPPCQGGDRGPIPLTRSTKTQQHVCCVFVSTRFIVTTSQTRPLKKQQHDCCFFVSASNIERGSQNPLHKNTTTRLLCFFYRRCEDAVA